ncbi:TetR/AcrR family transcriptional regulator [Pseudomonas putida]|uniref:TetR/AcrR family transcriptional regulator n=1 Tax=Pseudomonas putida TaxID=303 RepID=UPI00236471EA|nr:TetR/AcrR family transcriptional regulator [Pseudomonas putida]MDD2140820.1 TetR/AcrR family transcriptional regulator [Pseudomonas putida]HDS1725040.1 TetR/AcrR family transcriptional regulator [Pseudomonas putida]
MLEAARPSPSPLTQAATELMVEMGYTAMTMRKLALRVGILPGSLYHHVDCKQDLLLNVVLDIVERRKQAWANRAQPQDLHAYVRFALARQVALPQEEMILRHETRHLHGRHRLWLERAMGQLAEPLHQVIERGCAIGQYCVRDTARAAVALLAIIESANSLRVGNAAFEEGWIEQHILRMCNALLQPEECPA